MRRIGSRRRIAFWAILIGAVLALVEFGCLLLVQARPDLFDHREAALAKLQAEPFERFRTQRASRTLGWDHPAAQVVKLRACTGVELPNTYGPARDRLHGNSADAVVVVAGDSLTHGDDVGDADTYPAALERILGVPTANLGVGGYDPVQALLKLEAGIAHFPKARVAVLSILDDDVHRMPNSYRPVLFANTGLHFGLKPHWRDGAFHGLVGDDPFRDLAAMRRAATTAFDTDYWRRARGRFPYTLAVAEMLSLPSFWVPQLVAARVYLGYRQFETVYRLPSVQAGLRAIYGRFADFARARGLIPVVAFIPIDPNDTVSGLVAIAAASAEQREAITFVNVTLSKPDRYYTIRGCHPQAEGYRMIAESVAQALRPLLAGAQARSTD
jgi:hypothetical protein